MKIAMVAIGSRGDVQPYLALGRGLQASGHTVCVVTHAIFESFVKEAGLDFGLIRYDPQQALRSDTGQAAIASSNPGNSIQGFLKLINESLPEVFTDVLAACEGCDAIISSPLGFYCAPHVAEKLGVPLVNAYTLPVHPTSAFPNYLFASRRNLGALYNRLSYLPSSALGWIPTFQAVNHCRRAILKLSALSPMAMMNVQEKYPMVYGFSTTIIPKPADWPTNVEVTGYWFLDHAADWHPSSELLCFLEAGSKPIYAGFGSMNTRNAENTTRIIVEAAKRTNQRVILSTGWGGLSAKYAIDNVFQIDAVPHDWLFPQVAAVIHHGGAGTTAAGLRAGVPSIVVPFYLDQPFWGYRVAQMNAGPDPIPYKSLSVDKLITAIQSALESPQIMASTIDLGTTIRAEKGVQNAVKIINRHLSR